jgi:hypothetical protein
LRIVVPEHDRALAHGVSTCCEASLLPASRSVALFHAAAAVTSLILRLELRAATSAGVLAVASRRLLNGSRLSAGVGFRRA